eukprot:24403-Hanusia_phi.AAC.1
MEEGALQVVFTLRTGTGRLPMYKTRWRQWMTWEVRGDERDKIDREHHDDGEHSKWAEGGCHDGDIVGEPGPRACGGPGGGPGANGRG